MWGTLPFLHWCSNRVKQLPGGAAGVEVREPEGYKAGVPAPLVGVEVWGGPGPPAHVVASQDLRGPVGLAGGFRPAQLVHTLPMLLGPSGMSLGEGSQREELRRRTTEA